MLGVGLLTGLRLPGSECEVLESLLGLDSLTLRAFLQGVDFPGLWAQGVACQSMMRGDGSWGGGGGGTVSGYSWSVYQPLHVGAAVLNC